METKPEIIKNIETENYHRDLDYITSLALAKDIQSISKILEINTEDLNLSLSCVGDGLRKGSIELDKKTQRLTHFAHMTRVAFMVKYFFPDDTSGRKLAVLHDTKEEALLGQELRYQVSDISDSIELLTETKPTAEEIEHFTNLLPPSYDAEYFAEYKKYIAILHKNWNTIGAMELCDRLDGSTSFSYLLDSKYQNRLKQKSLESFGRIWATISIDNSIVSELIKENCRTWFNQLGITETEIQDISQLFL